MLTLYGIPNCNTVKTARQYLQDAGLPYTFYDFKKQGVDDTLLRAWLTQHPWTTLVNRSGLTWRGLDDSTKQSITDNNTAIALMQAKPSVIKRPILVTAQGDVMVGFDAERYARLKGSSHE